MKGKIPFTKEPLPRWNSAAIEAGSMVDYYGGFHEDRYEWRDPQEMTLDLCVVGMYRGRSAAGFELRCSNGRLFIMRLKETLNMLQHADVRAGQVVGVFDIVKQGSNYSLRYLRDK